MAKRQPTSVRFDETVAVRLAAFAASYPGLSLSSAANLLIDEGLRVYEHPGITFRDGATGRRAGLVGGPDVWEVVRAVRSARVAEPVLGEDALLGVVRDGTGLSTRLLRTALRYWAAYPDEIDAEIAAADEAELAAERAWQREQELFAR
jgi:hypothetical protein